jgi:hypothetical protein
MLHLNFFTSPRSGVPSLPPMYYPQKGSYNLCLAVTCRDLQLQIVTRS